MSNATQSTNVNRPFFRAKDAAAYLGIGVSTLWSWAKKGRIPKPIRLGCRCSVWAREDLEEFIEKNRQEGARA